MAALQSTVTREASKRVREKERKRKLLVGEEVEIRHFEDGLKGSWSSGVVVRCAKLVRYVECFHLLSENGSSRLIEPISVSPTVEGLVTVCGTQKGYRGNIRPLPPHSNILQSRLTYGLCVDALVNDAWWEGVIFDHNKGAGERLVFFPDEGDQLRINIKHLRVTQDWDEVSGSWNQRGNWLFLQFLMKIEQEGSLPVSVRQIWYDLRTNVYLKGETLDWTCSENYVWKKLVLEAVQENVCAAVGQAYSSPSLAAKEKIFAIRSGKKTSKSLKLHAMVGLGVQEDVPSAHVLCGRNEAEEDCPIQKSKRIKNSMPQSPASGVDSKIQLECSPLTLAEGIDQHNKKCQNSLSFPSELDAASFKPDLNFRSVDYFNLHIEDGRENISASRECVLVSDDFTSEDGLVADKTKSSKTCQVQSSANDLASSGQMKEHGTESPLWSPDQCVGQDSQVNQLHLAFPSGTDSATVQPSPNGLEGSIDLHESCSHFDMDLSTCGNAISTSPLCPASGTSNVHAMSYLEASDCAPLEVKTQPLTMGRVLGKDPSDLIFKRHVSPSGDHYCSSAEACTAWKDKGIVQDISNGNADVLMHYGQGVELNSHAAASENKATFHHRSFLLSKDPSCIPQLFMANAESRSDLLYKDSCPADGQLDSVVQQILLPDVLDEQQGTKCSPLCEENQVCDNSGENDIVVFGKEYCPQAMVEYYKFGKGKCKQNRSSIDIKQVRSKVKMHLSAEGWKIFYVKRHRKRELRYRRPQGKCFASLWTACKAWIESMGIADCSTSSSTGNELFSKKIENSPVSERFRNCVNTAIPHIKIERSALLSRVWTGNFPTWSFDSLRSSDSKSGEVRLTGVRKRRKKRDLSSFSVVSKPPSRTNAQLLLSSSPVDLKPDGLSSLYDKASKNLQDGSLVPRKRNKGKSTGSRIARGKKSHSQYLRHVLRSSKRTPQAAVSCSGKRTVRTVLSWLIDKDVVLPRQKVYYLHTNKKDLHKSKKDFHVLAEGKITREGIKCKCCKKVYSLSSFEFHAGSSKHRPAAHIFLQDGRSLLDCQNQVVCNRKFKGLRSDPDLRMKSDQSQFKSDNICSICRYGGKLVLCDHCPSSFHLSCIGLKDVPEGEWSCPSCRCGICGESDFNGDSEQFTEKTVLYCDQCECEYHVGCLRKRGMVGLEKCPQGNWFCSNECSKIFLRIQNLLGKPKQTDVKGLSWTLLRSQKEVSHDLNMLDAEHHSKLSVALGVMHECFLPLIDPLTKRDLVTDVIFNQWSELKRLNFRGFYTMLLERGDELISVATVRIYGEKVAEVPLIGTRVQYRRQGMCHLLMNELQKMLQYLEVERLLLPATSQMLEKWITSFGFTKMSFTERSNFLEYAFLEFQGTTMCQKVLMPSAESRSRGKKSKAKASEEMSCNQCSTVSEAIQNVESVTASLLMDAQVHPFQVESGTGEENTGCSSLSSNHCSSSEVILPDVGVLDQHKEMKQISSDVSAGSSGNNYDILPGFHVVTEKTDLKCQRFGLFYNRKKNMATLEKCTVDSTDVKEDNRNLLSYFSKHYQRRKILVNERSSFKSSGDMNIS